MELVDLLAKTRENDCTVLDIVAADAARLSRLYVD